MKVGSSAVRKKEVITVESGNMLIPNDNSVFGF